ncbi:major facilitator superfamily domain-containing protein [Mycena latifolia]|nr:major facilitator superfamily domain-containing protein [Mycena latifolia]
MEFPTGVPIPGHKSCEQQGIAVKELRPVTDIDLHSNKKDSGGDIEVLSSARSGSDDFPDGGFKAWTVAFGVRIGSLSIHLLTRNLCKAFWTFFSTSVFQVYYKQVVLPHSTPSEISWISSIQRCVIFLPGVAVGRLFDIGYLRVPFITGSILIIAGTFLLPLCKLYWHFILCQGLMIGIGFGLTLGNATTAITHWWTKKRGLAFGIATSGSAAGGVFFPIVMRELLNDLGFTWMCRIMGFVLIVTLGIANLCLRRRLPPRKAPGGLFGFQVFRNTAFIVFFLASLTIPLGSFIGISTVLAGISQNFAFYVVAIQNGSSGLGALVFGLYGDRLGAMNVLVQTITCLGIITIAWPFCHTIPSLTIIAILSGLAFGSFSALGLVPVAAMGGTEDLGRRIGVVHTALGLGGLCGPPLGGLLTSTSLGYKAVGFFGGGALFLGAALFALARFLAVPKLWSKF